MKYKTFNDLDFEPWPIMGEGGSRAYMVFANGYGISVITGEYAYTDETHPYEAAVMKEGECCYITPITDDVVGHLDQEGVTAIMKRIQGLAVKDRHLPIRERKKHLPTGEGVTLDGTHYANGCSLNDTNVAVVALAKYINGLIDKGILPEAEEE